MKKTLVFVLLILFFFLCTPSAWAVTEGGEICGDAVEVTPGLHSVSGPDNGADGASDCSGDDDAEWFSYTATADGLLEISSCGSGIDNVLYIHTTDCGDPPDCAVGGDNDLCSSDDNEEFATIYVTTGNTYLIEWTDGQETDGFDWTLTFDSGTPGGESCADAVAVVPGTYIAAGPSAGDGASECAILNDAGTINSEWFSYSPTEDGVIDIDSCGSAADTVLYIHTTSCDSEDCAAGGDNDGCGDDTYSESITRFPVSAGQTYLIEWTDYQDSSGFFWTLAFNRPVSIPTMGEWGMIIMSLMFLASGIIIMQRRQEQ